RRPIKDMEAYRNQLSARLDPSASLFQTITASVRANPKRVVFAEGEEEAVIRAAASFQNSGLGQAILVGREEIVRERIKRLGADTTVHEMPTAEELADITIQLAGVARRFGLEPRVALLAFSTFGYPRGERSERIIEAVEILARRKVDFEYDGEMAADVALDREKMALYPFCRLSDV